MDRYAWEERGYPPYHAAMMKVAFYSYGTWGASSLSLFDFPEEYRFLCVPPMLLSVEIRNLSGRPKR